MKAFLQEKWFVIILVVSIGAVIGWILIRPLLGRVEKWLLGRNKIIAASLVHALRKIAPFFSIVFFLHFINLYPITVKFDFTSTYGTILKVLDVIILTFIAAEFLIFVYDNYSNSRLFNKTSSLFHIVIRILVYTAGVFAVSSILKYDVKALLTAMGVGGLAIALALQDTLVNLFAGMQILASKQLKTGDYISIENAFEGYVIDVNWRNTEVKTLEENVIMVPNSKISSSITTNYFTLQKNLYFPIFVGVHYDSDLEFVEKVTLEVAEEVLAQYPNLPKGFKPRVRFYEFAESSIKLKVFLVSDLYERQRVIRHDFIKKLHQRYNKEGITIPFPIRTVYMHKDE